MNSDSKAPGIDLAAVRERLAGQRGRDYWRSLDELAGTDEFQEWLHREFPRQAAEWVESPADGVSRRRFLQLASASLALAGLTGCTKQPVERIVPYVRQPEEIVPGRPLFFATTLTHAGYGMGVLAESHEGRPTKIEGNPGHPASRGATDAFAQAAVLTLYDPARSQSLTELGRIRTWGGFVNAVAGPIRALRGLGGEGLRILTGSVTSPTLAAQMQALLRQFPRARWHRWEAAGDDFSRRAATAAFGAPLDAIYDFTRAQVVVALESDFLAAGPAAVRYSRDFSRNRRPRAGHPAMSRFYAAESSPTTSSTVADHRLPVSPAELEAIALALATDVGAGGGGPLGRAPEGDARTLPGGAPGTATVGAGPSGRTPEGDQSPGGASRTAPEGTAPALSEKARAWVAAAAEDLRANAGAGVVVAGPHAPVAVQVLAHAINGALGNIGRTVSFIPAVEADPVDHLASLAELTRDLAAGAVELLVVAGTNPVYSAPADLGFARALLKAKLRVHHGLYADETAQLCHWHVSALHELESWGDARSFDGTASLVQPLIEPLYEGKSLHELLAVFFDRIDATAYDVVREFWATHPGGEVPAFSAAAPAGQTAVPSATAAPGPPTGQSPGGSPGSTPGSVPLQTAAAPPSPAFERAWRRALHDGVVPNTASRPTTAAVPAGAVAQAAAAIAAAPDQPIAAISGAPGERQGLTLLFRPDPTLHDGRYAPNSWLQELPKPWSKLTWDNALMLSPATAQRLDLHTEQVVKVGAGGRYLRVPVWIQPGHGDGCATLHLGHGRRVAGPVGSGHGFDAYALRTSREPWSLPGATLDASSERYPLASTQNHHLLENGDEEIRVATEEFKLRRPVRTGTLEQFRRDTSFLRKEAAPEAGELEEHKDVSLYPEVKYDGHRWAMSIDLNACTGCSACVVACQAENNIPTVGKEQVLKEREMHWLRIDRYFEGDLDDPLVHNQPVPCMQCEKAPCEVVCPVAATAHSAEGLNDMVYNRCVGTRYCSNNCPYKVRRFNFLRYSNHDVPVLKLLANPDVTVRMRGVMEKCTYCVQRINKAKIDSEVAGRRLRPGEVETACAQACPTEAIVFGDMNDRGWEVTRRKAEPLDYALLEELDTQPRTTYLAKLRNVNPRLAPAEGS
jgi:MoCo/4Fe-4S cofactor protein with predicted Tat translocation signal